MRAGGVMAGSAHGGVHAYLAEKHYAEALPIGLVSWLEELCVQRIDRAAHVRYVENTIAQLR